MKVTKANLECADVILQNNMLYGASWQGLRHDIAFALTLAEKQAKEEVEKRLTTPQKKEGE